MGVAFPVSDNTIINAPQAAQLVRVRRFRLDVLPSSLARNSEHLQLWDNYLPATDLRLRKIRTPATNQYRLELAQKTVLSADSCACRTVTVMPLSARAYNQLWTIFQHGGELRKNRYIYTHDGRDYALDVFLGHLWGLILAQTFFPDEATAANFVPPDFLKHEVTHDARFSGENLPAQKLADLENLN